MAKPVVLSHRPQISRDQAVAALRPFVPGFDRAILLGVRGYEEAMGDAGKNDRGIYDDAIALLSPSAFVVFNANTDPSEFGKGKASLVENQLVTFRIGTHNQSKPKDKQYEALVQASKVIVFRDGTEDVAKGTRSAWGECLGDGRWTNYAGVPSFGLNCHRGGEWTTGSEGCQTVYKPQWPSFIELVKMEMKRCAQRDVGYVLVGRAALPT